MAKDSLVKPTNYGTQTVPAAEKQPKAPGGKVIRGNDLRSK